MTCEEFRRWVTVTETTEYLPETEVENAAVEHMKECEECTEFFHEEEKKQAPFIEFIRKTMLIRRHLYN